MITEKKSDFSECVNGFGTFHFFSRYARVLTNLTFSLCFAVKFVWYLRKPSTACTRVPLPQITYPTWYINTQPNSSGTQQPMPFTCTLQAHSSKIPSIVPYPGVLQRPLAAGYCVRANGSPLAVPHRKGGNLRIVTRSQKKKLRFLAPSQVHEGKALH